MSLKRIASLSPQIACILATIAPMMFSLPRKAVAKRVLFVSVAVIAGSELCFYLFDIPADRLKLVIWGLMVYAALDFLIDLSRSSRRRDSARNGRKAKKTD
jgi:hypothetical protein